MTEITQYDERRKAEITIRLNDDHQVVGCQVYFVTPIPLYEFSFVKVAMVQNCGGCSEKGLPRSQSAAIPDPIKR
jgi:hypothetical protein